MSNETKDLFDLRPLWSIEDLDIFQMGPYLLGLPDTMGEQLKTDIMDLIAASSLRITYAYYKKRYARPADTAEASSRIHLLHTDVKNFVKSHVLEMHGIFDQIGRIDAGPYGAFAANSAIVRLAASFRALLFLSKNGYFLEMPALMRQILEQIAWSYSVHGIANDSFWKVVPQKTIAALRSFIPHSGRLYGILSELAHVHPDATRNYIYYDQASDSYSISLTSTLTSLTFSPYILSLTDIYVRVSEVLVKASRASGLDATTSLFDHAERAQEIRTIYDKIIAELNSSK